MAWTQSDIDKLKKAMAKGVRRVRYISGEVEYQDVADMERVLKLMEAEVNGRQPVRRTVGRFSSGF